MIYLRKCKILLHKKTASIIGLDANIGTMAIPIKMNVMYGVDGETEFSNAAANCKIRIEYMLLGY